MLRAPKSWVLGRKLRTSNFFPESHQKEKTAPPSWFSLNSNYMEQVIVWVEVMYMSQKMQRLIEQQITEIRKMYGTYLRKMIFWGRMPEEISRRIRMQIL